MFILFLKRKGLGGKQWLFIIIVDIADIVSARWMQSPYTQNSWDSTY
jgi:hypothetical protein